MKTKAGWLLTGSLLSLHEYLLALYFVLHPTSAPPNTKMVCGQIFELSSN